jgi:hypothetical protein
LKTAVAMIERMAIPVEMEKFLIKKRKTTESTDTRTVPGKIKLVYSGLPHNGTR